MNLAKLFTRKLPPEKVTEALKRDRARGILHTKPEEYKDYRGAWCPKCGTFYPLAAKVSACNICGYKVNPELTPKPWMIKKHDRIMNKQRAIVAARDAKRNAPAPI